MKYLTALKRIVIGFTLVYIMFFTVLNRNRIYMLIFAELITIFCVMEMTFIRTRMLDIMNTDDEEGVELPIPVGFFARPFCEQVQTLMRMFMAALYPLATFWSENEMRDLFILSFVVCLVLNFGTVFGIFHYGRKSDRLNLKDFVAAQIDFFSIFFFGSATALAAAHVKIVRFMPIYVAGAIAACDAGGLLFGKKVARKNEDGTPRFPLHSVLSPNKTIEGAIGALLGAIAAGFLVAPLTRFFNSTGIDFEFPDYQFWVVGGVVIGLIGIVGDLFESYFKRVGKVKDSSHMLGAHGGVLDRFDATIVAFPVAYLIHFFLFDYIVLK